MSFISYAQNNEDLMLFRALQGVVNGFYIDVGANDPVSDSVTKAFYDRGWHGINVEPLECHWKDLECERPKDINLRCVAGSAEGRVDIWEPSIRGWSTASPKVIEEHKSSGMDGVVHSVKMLTLGAICKQYASEEIHFLKIDVEGFEKDVLAGMDFHAFRPWIVVVEAFDPVSKKENFEDWESILTSNAYDLAYSDGLNRFYVAHEHSEFMERMKYPPNVFDDFVRAEQVKQTDRAVIAEKNLAQKVIELTALEKKMSELDVANSSAQAKLAHEKVRVAEFLEQTAIAEKKLALKSNELALLEQQLSELDVVHSSKLAELAHEKSRVAEFAEKAHEWWIKALGFDNELRSIKASWSWKAIYPLSVLLDAIAHPIHTFKQFVNMSIRLSLRLFAKPVSMLIATVLRNRNFSERLNLWLLVKYPALHSHLRAIAIQDGAIVDVASPKLLRSTMNPSHDARCDLGLLGVFPKYPQLPEGLKHSDGLSNKSHWVRFTGHLEGHYSLAIVNRNIVAALNGLIPTRVQYIPFHGKPYEKIPTLPEEQDRILGMTLRNQIPESSVSEIISITHHYPLIGDALPAGLKLGIFFWEETTVPIDTVAQLNLNFDGVIVAAESVKVALINSGCQKPVIVVPIGIDHLITSNTEPVQSVVPQEGVPFRFLHISSAFHRKGVDVLLDAYLDAFTGDDSVELYIKTFPNPHNQVSELLNVYAAKHKHPARVVIDEKPLDDAGMIELYRTAHSVVLPTRGEGFNLPAAEALAMGIPVITTGHSAQIDFCTLSTAHLVGFQFAASESHLRADDACWVNPGKADLVMQLRKVRERVLAGDSRLNDMRRLASTYVRDTYSWQNAAMSIMGFADRLLEGLNPSNSLQSIALLTPWGAKCGIAEYSEKLFKSVVDAGAVATQIYSDARTLKADPNVAVTWKVGDTASVIQTLRLLHEQKVNAIFVQHQPSLYELSDMLCEELAALQRNDRGVYLELHSTQPLLAEFRLTPHAVRCLGQLDRIIVHKVEDLNNLLSLGLWRNVVLLKLGVIQPLQAPDVNKVRHALGISQDALVLGCFGFALAHKGLDAVVGSIPLLTTELNRPVHMLAVCTALDERSAHVIKNCKAQAERLGVSKHITWITDYRPITDCQELLSSVNYMVLPYRDTQESASGAVTIALSTLKPVLVSPLSIFSDVSDVSLQMSGSKSEDICKKVLEWESGSKDAQLALFEKQLHWLKARDWMSVSQRLLHMASALRREALLRKVHSDVPEHPTLNPYKSDRRIFVDISELYIRDAKTGIQRVVRNILFELQSAPPSGYLIYPVYGIKGKGFFYTSKFDAPMDVDDGAAVYPSADDIFLGLDLTAHLFPEIEVSLMEFKRAGARIFYVVYDIIPLLHNQYAYPGIEPAFQNWMSGLSKHADGLFCISKSVMNEVKDWLRMHGGLREGLQIDFFHLGADFDGKSPLMIESDIKRDPTLKSGLPLRFLMVGTIEPRKGHAQVLEAFKILWDKGVDVQLAIVGKEGWNVEKFIEDLRSSNQLNKKLFWYGKANDDELDALYSSSACLIAASYAEGFGLPLVEASNYGIPIFARNIPVFREIAGGGARFFNSISDQSLADELLDWIHDLKNEAIEDSNSIEKITWHQSAQELCKLLAYSDDGVDLFV